MSLDGRAPLPQTRGVRGHLIILGSVALTLASVATADEQPICADRPGKANPTCTVPTGMVQIETGLVDWIHDDQAGVRTDSLSLASTAFKYGVNDRWNLELDVTPYESVHVRAGGIDERDSSFGDMFVRSKYRFTSGDGVQVAINPFVKIPSASRPIGNRKFEAGIAFPIDYSIPKSTLSITLGPEIDWVENGDDHGHHAAMAQVVGVGWSVTQKLNLSAELWGQWDWDPAGTTKQATADGAIAYLVNNNVQLDAGANFGLNRVTPHVELYGGVSVRF